MKDNRPDSEKLAALVYPVVNNLFGFFRVLRLLVGLFFLLTVIGAIYNEQFFAAIFFAVLAFLVIPNRYIAPVIRLFRRPVPDAKPKPPQEITE
jgi:hypothetical protein